MTDATLLDRCRRGEDRAWRELVARYAGLIFAVARRQGLSNVDAEDIAQSVLAQLAANLGAIRDPAALPGWLATTARRESRRFQRRATAAGLAVDAPEPAAPAREDSDLERHQLLRIALDELGGRCRDLLHELYFVPTKPDYEAIARRLGMPVGSIGPTRARCLAKLADLLAEAGQEKSGGNVSSGPGAPPKE